MMRITKNIMYVLMAVTFVFTAISGAEVITYRKHIKPLFDGKCLACHGVDAAPEYDAFKAEKERWLAKGQGMKMDTYSHLIFYTAWPDTGALMRRLDDGSNTKDGKPGNMYQHLGTTEEERKKNLALFKSWVGNWTMKRWADISKKDMNGIKIKY